MRKVVIALLAMALLIPAFNVHASDNQIIGISYLDSSGSSWDLSDARITYKIDPMSKEKHQLNVNIQFNAIPYAKVIEIMGTLKRLYGDDSGGQKACEIEFVIDR